jgi:hypothetical protein
MPRQVRAHKLGIPSLSVCKQSVRKYLALILR